MNNGWSFLAFQLGFGQGEGVVAQDDSKKIVTVEIASVGQEVHRETLHSPLNAQRNEAEIVNDLNDLNDSDDDAMLVSQEKVPIKVSTSRMRQTVHSTEGLDYLDGVSRLELIKNLEQCLETPSGGRSENVTVIQSVLSAEVSLDFVKQHLAAICQQTNPIQQIYLLSITTDISLKDLDGLRCIGLIRSIRFDNIISLWEWLSLKQYPSSYLWILTDFLRPGPEVLERMVRAHRCTDDSRLILGSRGSKFPKRGWHEPVTLLPPPSSNVSPLNSIKVCCILFYCYFFKC
jgi:hypothetical protein